VVPPDGVLALDELPAIAEEPPEDLLPPLAWELAMALLPPLALPPVGVEEATLDDVPPDPVPEEEDGEESWEHPTVMVNAAARRARMVRGVVMKPFPGRSTNFYGFVSAMAEGIRSEGIPKRQAQTL
jgi:hypothetical protein